MHKRVLRIRAKPRWIIHAWLVRTQADSNSHFFNFFFFFLFLFSYIWFSFWRKPSLYPSPVNWDFKLKSVVNGVVAVSNGINTRFVNTVWWNAIRINSICSNFANVRTNSDDDSGTPESWKRRQDDIFVGPPCDLRKLSYFLKRRTSHPSWIKLQETVDQLWTVYFRIIFIDEVIRDTIARATISGKMLKHGKRDPSRFWPVHARERLMHFYEIQFLVELWRVHGDKKSCELESLMH